MLFLRNSLSRSKFAELLAICPQSVVNQLAVYLEKRNKRNELSELYSSLGRYNDSALIQYKAECSLKSGLEVKIRRLKAVLNTHFQSNPDSQHVIEHLNLLERASPVLANPVKDANAPPTEPITVHNLLAFCSYNYFGAPENLLHSPLAIKKCHKLTEKQFAWASLHGRAAKSAWKDCETLVLAKGWLGGTKVKGDIDPLEVSRLLHSSGAPGTVLRPFVELIEPLEEREKFAKKVGAHAVVVDVFVLQRDRTGLQNYLQKLIPQSEDWFYANNALTTTNTKWKN